MIVEVASIRVAPENAAAFEAAVREAVAVFGRAEGCRGMQLMRGVESPDQYRLLIRWDSLEAHTVGFREGPLFPEWRGLVGRYFAEPPSVVHYATAMAAVDF